MFGYFYNTSIRRYILLMGELFNGIQVSRTRGDVTTFQKVPITYASKERFISKLNKINSTTSEYDIAKIETILPRMYLHMVDMVYNPLFKTNASMREIKWRDHEEKSSIRFNPVPYKFIFELGIYTRFEDDMFQIAEQIFPYFQPNFAVRIKELHDTSTIIDRDVQVTIQSISMTEDLEGDGTTRRRLEWNFIFELDGWMYPPSSELSGEIRTIYLDFHSKEKELDSEGQFESVDTEVDPRDIGKESWDGSVNQTYSHDQQIPSGDIPPGPRTNPDTQRIET